MITPSASLQSVSYYRPDHPVRMPEMRPLVFCPLDPEDPAFYFEMFFDHS